MAKRREKEPKELTRKQIRINRREQEQARRIRIFTGTVIGLVLLVIALGLIDQFVLKPNSAIAKVGDVAIRTADYWKRVKWQRYVLQNQLDQLRALDAQFSTGDGPSLFSSQISQIEALLSNQETLSIQVLDRMIDEEIVRQTAAQRGIVVTDEEIEAEVRSQVARSRNSLTEPQATATAQAQMAATATAALWTPTPTPTPGEAAEGPTATPTPEQTPTPTPTIHILTDDEYREGLDSFAKLLDTVAGMTLDDYRKLVAVQLLEDKLREQVAAEVPTTEEQVHARHILIATRTPAPTPTPTPTLEATPTPTEGEASPTPTVEPTPTLEPRSDEEALALAQELVSQLRNGADFAALAKEYSDDFSSRDSGGDLGWFGRGRMVPEFEEAAFSLDVGEISDPVKTVYGYHIIQVLEKDPARPVDSFTLEQRRSEAYQKLIDEQRATLPIERNWSPDKVPPTTVPSAPLQ